MLTMKIPCRIKFTTADRVLVMDREADADYFIRDAEFLEYLLKFEARERGVRIVNFNYDRKASAVNAIVAWL